MTCFDRALLERPNVDLKIRLHHQKHAEVADAIQLVLAADDGGGPTIVPLLGPTRCGKTQILQELSLSRGRMVSGPGSLLAGADFRIGAIPPRPSERDIYKALLQACEYCCPDRERTDAVRRRAFRAMRDQGVRFIALDECNHLTEEGPKHEMVTLDVPFGILKDLRLLVDAGIYLSVEEALRESIVANWRFMRGSYHSARIKSKDADVDEAEAGECGTTTGADMVDDNSPDSRR